MQSRPWQVVASEAALLDLQVVVFSLWPPKVNAQSLVSMRPSPYEDNGLIVAGLTHPSDRLLRPCLQILPYLGIRTSAKVILRNLFNTSVFRSIWITELSLEVLCRWLDYQDIR